MPRPRITDLVGMDLAKKTRQAVEQAFAAEGITAPCDSPEQTRNPDLCDVGLSDTVLQLALLLEDVFLMHGLDAVSMAHAEEDIERLGDTCGKAAKRFRAFL